MRRVLLVAARSAGVAVVAALLSACSSQPSRNAAQQPNSGSRGPGGPALSTREEVRLAGKAKAKDEALLFVGRAQIACRDLSRKTEALTLGSTVDTAALRSFIPPELYPTDSFAAYVDDATLGEVKSQLNQIVSSTVELLRSLERTKTRIERQPEDVAKDRAMLQEGKLKTIANITIFCESVRRAGTGEGPIP